MPITGNSADLPLIDLIQANVLVRNVCRITVAGPAGSGVMFLADGTVVHATYGNLEGRDAFFALVGTGDVFFQVETGLRAPRRTILEKWENLALEAMRLKDEGKLPLALAASPAATRPAAVVTPPPPTKISILSQEAPPRPAAFPARPTPPAGARRKPDRRPLVLASLAVGVLLLAGIGYVALTNKPAQLETDQMSPASAPSAPAPIEASELTQPGDVRPALLTGTPPPSPLPDLAIRPTIVCRILIGTDGTVQQAQVYQSRLDLAAFEEAAVQAVRGYRFKPAARKGTPVPVWVNWPVSFQ